MIVLQTKQAINKQANNPINMERENGVNWNSITSGFLMTIKTKQKTHNTSMEVLNGRIRAMEAGHPHTYNKHRNTCSPHDTRSSIMLYTSRPQATLSSYGTNILPRPLTSRSFGITINFGEWFSWWWPRAGAGSYDQNYEKSWKGIYQLLIPYM